MLVLSRKPNQKLVFPTLNMTIQVVEINRGVVRLSIDAPPEVTILREEIPYRAVEWAEEKTRLENCTATEGTRNLSMRQLRDRLTTTGLGLGLLHLQLDLGLMGDAKTTLARVQDDLQLLRYGVEGEMEKPPTKARKSHTALLVEDNRNERELLAGFLRQSGLEVDTAGDGSDALEYLHSHAQPDVILLDMGLPYMDGPTMVREIRRDPTYAGIKIFGVTGHLPEEFDLERGPAGIDRWFLKPLDPTAFLHDLTEEVRGSLCGA